MDKKWNNKHNKSKVYLEYKSSNEFYYNISFPGKNDWEVDVRDIMPDALKENPYGVKLDEKKLYNIFYKIKVYENFQKIRRDFQYIGYSYSYRLNDFNSELTKLKEQI